MAKVIVLANQKGGVGKTTLALAVGQALSSKGKVLFIDLDSQANLTLSLEARDKVKKAPVNVLQGECKAKSAIIKLGACDILPADKGIALFASNGDVSSVRRIVAEVGKAYDYIVIDTPPAIGNLSIAGMIASDYLIAPVQADILSISGLGDLYETINAVKTINPGIQFLGIAVNCYDSRPKLSKTILAMLEDTAKAMQTKVFNAKIRKSVTVMEAISMQTNIFAYAPKAKVTGDLLDLVNEIDQGL